jgi:hypothetical protein
LLELRIANASYHGGVEAAPAAGVTSGDLVVHLVTGHSKWRLLKTWGKIAGGLEPDGPGFQSLRLERFHLEAEPTHDVNVDGETATRTPVDLSIAPKALTVLVPPASTRRRLATVRIFVVMTRAVMVRRVPAGAMVAHVMMPGRMMTRAMPAMLDRMPPAPLPATVARHELTAGRAHLAELAPHAGLDAAAVRDRVATQSEHVVPTHLLRLGVEIGLRLCLSGEERKSQRRDDAEPGLHGGILFEPRA